MRDHFLIGIVGTKADSPTPVDVADFVVRWEGERMLMGIKFCPFCGKQINWNTDELRSL